MPSRRFVRIAFLLVVGGSVLATVFALGLARALERRATEVPIVLVSGVTDLFKVAELVGTPYSLGKPYDLDRISALVSRALGERTPPTPKLLPAPG